MVAGLQTEKGWWFGCTEPDDTEYCTFDETPAQIHEQRGCTLG